MFGQLLTTWRLNEAFQILKKALRFMPMVPFDVETVAPILIQRTFALAPTKFNGVDHPRPKPITIVAMALVVGMEADDLQFEFPKTARKHLFLALGNTLLEIGTKGARYGLQMGDLALISIAEQAYLEEAKKSRPEQDALLGPIGL